MSFGGFLTTKVNPRLPSTYTQHITECHQKTNKSQQQLKARRTHASQTLFTANESSSSSRGRARRVSAALFQVGFTITVHLGIVVVLPQ